MSGVSARDYGGGLATKGWEKNSGPQVVQGEDLDEEAAKQVKPEKTAAEEKDEERQRWKRLHQADSDAFAAAQAEQKQAGTGGLAGGGLASAALERAAAANKKRELPKILQIKKRADEAPLAKQPRIVAVETAAKPEQDEEEPAGGGLLAAYGSSSEEDD